ncbi:hypothetical protein CEK00_21445, partial [Stenotrophomonas maltophilia]
YALIVELLKRQSHEQLSEIRQWLADYTARHGGPEAQAPGSLRIALIGLRGAGKSTPLGEYRDNTTPLLIEDIERLRQREPGVSQVVRQLAQPVIPRDLLFDPVEIAQEDALLRQAERIDQAMQGGRRCAME